MQAFILEEARLAKVSWGTYTTFSDPLTESAYTMTPSPTVPRFSRMTYFPQPLGTGPPMPYPVLR